MKELASLNPKWTGILRTESGEGLEFDCPSCGPKHRLAAYFDNPIDGKPPAAWQKPTWHRTGDAFVMLTIVPSIQYPCWHGWIENGHAIDVRESPITVMLAIEGKIKPVALSPMQAIALGRQLIDKLGGAKDEDGGK